MLLVSMKSYLQILKKLDLQLNNIEFLDR